MQYIKLKDGSYLEAPDDATDDQIRSKIEKIQGPKEEKKSPSASFADVMKEVSRQGFGRQPSIGALPEVAKARETPVGQALELPLYLAAPEASVPRLGAALSKVLPRAGKYITSGIQQALPQAAISGAMAPLSDQNAAESAATTGAITAPISALSSMIGSADPRARLAGRLATMAGTGSLGYLGAKHLGANPFESSVAGAVGAFLPGLASKMNRGVEKGAINQFMEGMVSPAEKKEAASLYKQTSKDLVAPPDLAPMMESNVFKKAEKEVLKNPAYKDILQGAEPNSVQHLHQVMRRLRAQERIKSKSIEKGDQTQSTKIGETADNLKKILYDANPSFEKAQEISERNIARKKIDSFFDAREKTGRNFAKYLSSEKRFNELSRNLRNNPESRLQLDALKETFDKIKDIKPSKGMSKLHVIKDIANTYKHDKAMEELISNPAFKGKLDDLRKISDKEKLLSEFVNVLGKAGAYVKNKPSSKNKMSEDENQ